MAAAASAADGSNQGVRRWATCSPARLGRCNPRGDDRRRPLERSCGGVVLNLDDCFSAHFGIFSSKLPCFRPQMSPYSGGMHSRAPPRLRNIVAHARMRRAPVGVWLLRRASRQTGLKWAKMGQFPKSTRRAKNREWGWCGS